MPHYSHICEYFALTPIKIYCDTINKKIDLFEIIMRNEGRSWKYKLCIIGEILGILIKLRIN